MQVKSGVPNTENKRKKLLLKSEKKCKVNDIRNFFEIKMPTVPIVPPGSGHAKQKTKANSTSANNTHMQVHKSGLCEEKGSVIKSKSK